MATSDDGVYDIYRFYNTQTGAHFYTASEAERDNVRQTLPQFSYEGNSYDSNAVVGQSAGATAVYRFFNTTTGTHFYTASEAEKDSVLATLPQYSFEGVSYYAYNSTGPEQDALFRFFNTLTGTHFYTTSVSERDTVRATLSQYEYEGIAYYVGGVGGTPAESQLDLTTTSPDAQSLTANTAASSSIKIGGGTSTVPEATSPYWTVTGVETSDNFELVTTRGSVGRDGTNFQGEGGDGGDTFNFAPLSDTGTNTLTLSMGGGATVQGGAGGPGGNPSFSFSRSGDGGDAINATPFEVLNISSTGTSANAVLGGSAGTSQSSGQVGVAGTSITLADGATINVTGTQNLDLGTLGGTSSSVNAASFTGNLSVIGNAGNNSFVGGAGNDTIGSGNGSDTMTGNGGTDTFVMSRGVEVLLANRETDTITDFDAATEILRSVSSDRGVAQNNSGAGSAPVIQDGKVTQFDAGIDTLAQKITAIEGDPGSGIIGSRQVVFFEHDSSTYVFFEHSSENFGSPSTDSQVVILTGVTGLNTLTDSGTGDFMFS